MKNRFLQALRATAPHAASPPPFLPVKKNAALDSALGQQLQKPVEVAEDAQTTPRADLTRTARSQGRRTLLTAGRPSARQNEKTAADKTPDTLPAATPQQTNGD